MTNRIAVVLLEGLAPGETANVAALLVGQVACSEHGYFNRRAVGDADGTAHAAPNYSVVVLKARNPSQLNRLVRECGPQAICFTRLGQTLNNAYAEYERQLSVAQTEGAGVVGVVVFGEDQTVRAATRKFSLLR